MRLGWSPWRWPLAARRCWRRAHLLQARTQCGPSRPPHVLRPLGPPNHPRGQRGCEVGPELPRTPATLAEKDEKVRLTRFKGLPCRGNKMYKTTKRLSIRAGERRRLVVNLEGATVGLRSSGHPGCLHRRVAGCQQPTCCWRSCCKGPGFLLSIVLPHLLSGSQSIASTFTCVRRQYCHAWTQPRGCP